MVARRAEQIKPFIVMDVLEKACELECRGQDIIHLEVGEPDFDTPYCVKEAAIAAIKEGFTHYTIRTRHRDGLRGHLARRGIKTDVYYPLSIHLQEAFGFLGYHRGDFPRSERAQAEVLSLPFDVHTTDEMVEGVCRAVGEYFGR